VTSIIPWRRDDWGVKKQPRPPKPPPDPIVGPQPEEYVIDAVTGRVRQAGAAQDDTPWIAKFRERCEQSLYLFSKAIMRRDYLTPTLHLAVCEFLQGFILRLLLLLPREHCKTTLCSHCLPPHVFVQPKENNVYFPGLAGIESRLVLSCETEKRAKDHLRVVAATFESNRMLRALWPHVCWQNPRKESKKWNDSELILPRDQSRELADPSLRALGVDAAIAGAHPDGIIKDDLISLEAANSPTVMDTARTWHIASRALINDDHCREWTLGTRWAIGDIYESTLLKDPTIEAIVRSVEEGGQPIYPEKFSMEKIKRLEREMGPLFWLLYMNCATHSTMTDFQPDYIRRYSLEGDSIVFPDDNRDAILADREASADAEQPAQEDFLRGAPLTRETYDVLRSRAEYLRLRAI
jgi:hypothetical protein